MVDIIVSIIGAISTISVALITAKKASIKADRYDAKHAIVSMIMEDRMLAQEGKFPVNYQNILHEFDIYRENGGNSYIAEKVEAYKEWFKEQEKNPATPR